MSTDELTQQRQFADAKAGELKTNSRPSPKTRVLTGC